MDVFDTWISKNIGEKIGFGRGDRKIRSGTKISLWEIEQCWGYAKNIYWLNSSSSREDQLEKNALAAVDAVPLVSMWNVQSDHDDLWMHMKEAWIVDMRHGQHRNTRATTLFWEGMELFKAYFLVPMSLKVCKCISSFSFVWNCSFFLQIDIY